MYKNLSTKEKWIKEILGLPTYLGAALLGLGLPNGGLLLVFIIIIPAAAIYNHVYDEIFFKRQVEKISSVRLHLFLGQISFWAVVLLFASQVVK